MYNNWDNNHKITIVFGTSKCRWNNWSLCVDLVDCARTICLFFISSARILAETIDRQTKKKRERYV